MQALPLKEAAQLKSIARKHPPLRVEDELSDTMSMDKMLGNPRQRLSRLLRTAARQRAVPRISSDNSFCPLSSAVVVLTSSASTTALSIGVSREKSSDDLFEAFFFSLDVDGKSNIDTSRFDCVREDIEKAHHEGHGESIDIIGVDTFIHRILKLQTIFGQGEWLRRDELDQIAMYIGEYRAQHGGPVISYPSLFSFLCSSSASSTSSSSHTQQVQKRERRSILHSLRLRLTGVASKTLDELFISDDIVDPVKLHSWLMKEFEVDMTEAEILGIMRDMAADRRSRSRTSSNLPADCCIDRTVLEDFVLDGHVSENKRDRESFRPIIDVQVKSTCPPAPAGMRYHRVSVRVKSNRRSGGDLNYFGGVSTSLLPTSPMFIWYLRGLSYEEDDETGFDDDEEGREISCSTTRLPPVVDLRIEEEKLSADLVAAGYIYVGSLGRASRHLWIRRAQNRSEARDCCLLDLALTAGEMRRMDDDIHFAPSGKSEHGWSEVGGRSKSSVPLVRSLRRVDDDDSDDLHGNIKGRDMKLWCKRNMAPSDRLSVCLKWSLGQKRRELDKSVKRGLRQLPLGVTTEGPHAVRLDCAVNLNRLFNERFSFGNMSPAAFNKLLLAAGVALSLEDSHSLFRRISVVTESTGRVDRGLSQSALVAFASRSDEEIDSIALHLKLELRKRFGISRHVPEDVKARQATALADQLALVARADRRGLGVHHLNFLVACSPELESEGNAHLTKQEIWQLARVLDPAFRGTISLTSLIGFMCEDSRDESGHVDRVLAAADVMRETVEGLLGRPKIGSLEQAASEVWRTYCDTHFRRLGLPLPPRYTNSLLMCLGDHGGAYRSVEIDAEDLCGVVERRLSPSDSSKLCFLLAPCNPTGRVSRREDFFASDVASGRMDASSRDRLRRTQAVRPVAALLDDLSSEHFLGSLLDVYKQWVDAASAVTDLQKSDQDVDEKVRNETEQQSIECSRKFSTARDAALKAIVSLLPDSKHAKSDPAVRAAELVGAPWASFGSSRAQAEEKEDDTLHPPFRTVNEVALLVLTCDAHVFEDEIDEGNSDSDQSDSETEHRPRRRERPKPPPPLTRPWSATTLTTSIHGIHLVRLRSLLEGLCRAKHGMVPHVVISDQLSSTDLSAAEDQPLSKKDIPELPELKFRIGDKEALNFLSSVVRQIGKSQQDKKETTDGWLGGVVIGLQSLAQAFNHPSVDPQPSRGKVSMRLFRKALRLCGVSMSQEEVEDSCELWLHESLVDYPRFLILVRRAWTIEWNKDSGADETGELKEARVLLILLRAHFAELFKAFKDNSECSRIFKKLYRSASGDDGRISCGAMLDCIRTATEIVEERKGKEVTWAGEEENLPLAGGRARRIMRRLFDFLDDEGDGRVDPSEFHAMLAYGDIGGSIVEPTLRSTDKTWDHFGPHSSDEEDEGDWLLTSINGANHSMSSLQGYRTRSRLRKSMNEAVPEAVATHPIIEKFARAVNDIWNDDREALKKYLGRYVNEQGTISESRVIKFLNKAGLSEGVSRKELTSAMQCLDPTNSHVIPHSLILKFIVNRDEKEAVDPDDGKKLNEAQRKLKARELERIMRHIFDVATDNEALSGTGKLRAAFKHFDPRGKGVVSTSTASDVLAFLGCSLIDEECDLVWERVGATDGMVDYEALDHVIASSVALQRDRQQENARMLLNQSNPHVSFAADPSSLSPSRFFNAPLTAISKKNSFSLDPEDDLDILAALISKIMRAGEKESAAWGKEFDFHRFLSAHCNHEQVVGIETLGAVLHKLGVELDTACAHALQRRFHEDHGTINIAAFSHFVSQCTGSTPQPPPEMKRNHMKSLDGGMLGTVLKLVGASLAGQQRLGLNVRMAFEMHETISGSGCVEVEGFVESLRQLDLRLGMDQLQCIIDEFAVRSDRGMEVDYRKFLDATTATSSKHQHHESISRFPPNMSSSSFQLSPQMPSPQMRRSLDTSHRQPYVERPPPLITSPSRNGIPSPAREAAVAIWGVGTPLQNRGKIPTHTQRRLDEAGKWMCLTCLYSENTPEYKTCMVCGASNPSGTDSIIQQECPSCHFLNGSFAKSCDMCQRPLAQTRHHLSTPQNRKKKHVDNSFGWRHGDSDDE